MKTAVAIACGGTGGHLFPGVAVGRELVSRGHRVLLLVSEKEIDRQALECETGFQVVTLPTVGVQGLLAGLRFMAGTWKSRGICLNHFQRQGVSVVLSMGGFTSAGPILAGRKRRSRIYLHDSNAVPGRANRWFARWADEVFVGFDQARDHLKGARVHRTGTPVRPAFYEAREVGVIRRKWGFEPEWPLVLVMGGSQGARGVNRSFLAALPRVKAQVPNLQVVHLTGALDYAEVERGYAGSGCRVVVKSFAHEMPELLASATVAVSRSGASSLAEFAASRLPAILVPYPQAADDHQTANARVMAESGAAWLCPQSEAGQGLLEKHVLEAVSDSKRRAQAAEAMAAWDCPGAAAEIVSRMKLS